jgi:hypothetical protein
MIGLPVELRDGGRRGKIVAGSLLRDDCWVCEWEGTNFLTHERERDIRVIVERKPANVQEREVRQRR